MKIPTLEKGVNPKVMIKETGLDLANLTESYLKTRTPILLPHNISDTARKSVTTKRYLAALEKTRILIDELTENQNHTLFKIVTLDKLSVKAWNKITKDLFSEAALNPMIETIVIIFPLQAYCWKYQLVKPDADADADAKQPVVEQSTKTNEVFHEELLDNFQIGAHIRKERKLSDTLTHLSSDRPVQVMYSQMSARMKMTDQDVADSAAIIKERNLSVYIHSPYTVNLCQELETDTFVLKGLQDHLKYGAAFGSKGVVVHVGKSVKRPLDIALDNQRKMVEAILEGATEQCPLLIETPAGQGSELLTKMEDLIEFVKSFKTKKLGLCIDTCHVFALGYQPDEYIRSAIKADLKINLIHFNDSKTACGSCLDRHESLGHGHVDKGVLLECAKLAQAHQIDMVIEFLE